MKKHLLLFLSVIFTLSAFAAEDVDLNPFAYNLYTTTTANGETDLHFSTNAKAQKIDIYLNVGGTWKCLPREYNNSGGDSYHTIITESDVNTLGLVYGQSYEWKVVVTPYDRSNVEYVETKRINMPAFSVDIDNNPQSKHFGRILVSNGSNTLGNNTHGIYEYYPNMELKSRYDGGISNSTYDWYNNQHLSPYRIRIAQDGSGRIFTTNYDLDKSVYLWQVNPDNLSSWTSIISRATATSMVGNDQYGKQNTLNVYNIGMDLKTDGNTYQLLLLSASRDASSTSFTYGNAYCGIYTIPNINTPNTGNYTRVEIPQVSEGSAIRQMIANAISSNAQFDKNNGIWYCGNAGYNGYETKEGLAHQILSSGDVKEDYNSTKDFQRYSVACGGIRHHYKNTDNRVVIAQGGTKTTDSGRADVIASIYSTNNSAHPSLTRIADLKVPEKDNNLWYIVDFAWDYADNIYACVRNASASYRGVHVFATDLNGTPIETPCTNSFVLSKEAELNPYAYDLSSNWDVNSQTLTVNFTLNAAPNLNSQAGSIGLQIYAVDKNKNKYPIYLVPSATIQSAPNGMKGPYSISIDLSKGKDVEGNPLPREILTWGVNVCGRSKDATQGLKEPQIVKYTIAKRPYRVHGIAVNDDENSTSFGQIYVTESLTSLTDIGSTWSWLSGKIPALLEYDPQLVYENCHKNNFADMDPHRVRVSKDGRVFVTSHQWDAATAVWEFKNGTFTQVIKDLPTDRRIMSIDTKGSGINLKLLVFYLDKTYSNYKGEGMYCLEYPLGTQSSVAYNQGVQKAHLSDFTKGSNQGLIYQAVYGNWYFSSAGLASAVYGPNDMIWMKLDFNTSAAANAASIHAFNSSGTKLSTIFREDYFWGAGATLMIGDTLIVGSCQDNSGVGMQGALQFYKANTNGTLSLLHNLSTAKEGVEYTGLWVTDMAKDRANNLYVASSYTANIMAIALPYGGETFTQAPAKPENEFQIGYPITWHPFHCPVEEFRNKDLWLMFMDAYNDWYKQSTTQPIVITRADQKIEDAFLFMFNGEKENDGITYKYPDGLAKEFMTDPNSPWKWLGDYILNCTSTVSAPKTNQDLWEKFKPYFNQYLKEKGKTITSGTRNENMSITEVTTFWDSGTDGSIVLTGADSEYKWLGDYISKVTTDASRNLNTDILWRYALSAFFNCSAENTSTYNGNANFTEAGKPENWGPYYKSSNGMRTIDTELEWREEIHAFFNAINEFSYKNVNDEQVTVVTADYTTLGQSDQENNGENGWFDEWWNATFEPILLTSDELPYLKRDGYLLEGWYYGTEQGFYYLKSEDRAGDYLYNEDAADGRTHLWARWIEASVNEGYSHEPDLHALDLASMGRINCNEEVVLAATQVCAKGKSVALDVQRKLQGGMYNTMTLPFAIPEKDYLKKVIIDGDYVFDESKGGAEPSILVFDGHEVIKEENGEEILQINFHELGDQPNNTDSEGREYESIPAYTPFLIKPADNITSRMHFWPAYISSAAPAQNAQEDIDFQGHFIPSKITIPEDSKVLILVADNRLAELTASETEMLGLRGYFVAPADLAQHPARIAIKEKTPMGEENTTISPENNTYKVLEDQRIYIITEQQKYNILGGACQ